MAISIKQYFKIGTISKSQYVLLNSLVVLCLLYVSKHRMLVMKVALLLGY